MTKNLFFLAIALFLMSCQKEVNFENSTNNGGSVIAPANTCESYFPLTDGSTWTYVQPGGVQVNTITAPDTVIQGKTFKRVSQNMSGVVTNNFFREEHGNIYAFIEFSTTVAESSRAFVNPLRSNAGAGAKWSDTITLNRSVARFEYEMVDKNIGHQVDTLYFPNTQHVQYKVRLDLGQVFTDELVQITDVWYANCIGVVETKSQLLTSSLIVGSPNKIKNYSIH